MRFIRFERAADNKVRVGSLSEDGKSFLALDHNDMIELIKSNPTADVLKSDGWQPLTSDIKLLAPIQNPEKIICIGLNYLGHCKEQNKEAPKEPMFFSKYASTITGPTGDVILHQITNVCSLHIQTIANVKLWCDHLICISFFSFSLYQQLDWEVELAVIIGKEARKVSKSDALDYVFGYSVAQDISARDWQKLRNGGQFLIGKSMDTFCPLGPAIVHKSLVPDPHNLKITCDINGVQKQNGSTNELIFRIDDIIHLLSQ